MGQYKGILVRQNLQDTGSVPRTGGWTACPDLIPYGTEPVQQPTDFFRSNYNQDVGKVLVANAENYVYVRGKNLTDSPLTGTARLFYAPQNLFLYPSVWLQNTMTTMNGSETSEISNVMPNSTGVTVDPFTWIPSDINDHHAFISIVSTPEHPYETQLPGDTITSLNELAAWIAKTGGIGLHNVKIIEAGAPVFTNCTHLPASSTLEKITFTITAENAPVGTEVSFSSGKPLPGGVYINLPKTTVTNDTNFLVGVVYEIPANWDAELCFSFYSNGKKVPQDMRLTMAAYVVTQGNDAIADYALPAKALFPDARYHNSATGQLEDLPAHRIVPVGSVSIRVK